VKIQVLISYNDLCVGLLRANKILKIIKYLIREVKNFFEYFLIPLLVVILPQRIYYPIFRFVCAYTFFYRAYSAGTHENAAEIIETINRPQRWNRNVRLLHLIDISDLWLDWLRPKKSKKLLKKNGEWESDKGFLALSTHWGSGFNALLDMRGSGINPFFVFSDSKVSFADQSFGELMYRKLRKNYFKKISGSVAIPTGGSYQMIKQEVSKAGAPVILVDAPKDKEHSRYSLDVLGHDFHIASGFIKLVCTEGIPFQLFFVQLDFETGEKCLTISDLKYESSKQQLNKDLSEFLQKLLINSPENWFFWQQSKLFFTDREEIVDITN